MASLSNGIFKSNWTAQNLAGKQTSQSVQYDIQYRQTTDDVKLTRTRQPVMDILFNTICSTVAASC